jgi:hypothetical protein
MLEYLLDFERSPSDVEFRLIALLIAVTSFAALVA